MPPDEWGSDEEPVDNGAVRNNLAVYYVQSDEDGDVNDPKNDGVETTPEPSPQNVFILDSSDTEPLRQIAADAFLGKNYPMVREPGHDAQHGSGSDKRAFTNIYSYDGLYEMGFPHLFFRGTGGPFHARHRPVSEVDLVAHLLRLHHKRFSRDAAFLFFSHSVIQRRTVNGVTSSLEESQKLKILVEALVDDLGQADSTRAEKVAALDKCIDSMTPQMTTVKGSQCNWQSKSKEVQAMVRSPLLHQPTLFMTLSAADSLWMDLLTRALPERDLSELASMTKTACAEALVANTHLAVEHFNMRWTALWEEIIMGEGRPLGNIVDNFWRIEFQERGSPHVHMLLWVDDGPELSGLSKGVIPAGLREHVDSVLSAKLAPDINDVDMSSVMHPCTMRTPLHEMSCPTSQTHVTALARCVQTHRCNKYCKPKGRHSPCRFGYPRKIHQECEVQRVFRNGKSKLVVSPARHHPRVNAYNPSILSCWAANMDVQVLLDAFGAAVYTASYLKNHEKCKHTPTVLYQLSKNARDISVQQMVRRMLLSVLNTREVSVQEALWIRTGKILCKASRVFITLPSLHFKLGEDTHRESDRNVFVRTDGSVSHTSALVLLYVHRPESLSNLSLFEYTTQYTFSKVPSPSLKLRARAQNYQYVARRRVDAIVFIRARIDSADVEIFSKAMLFLHVPWRSLDSIAPYGQNPSDLLKLAADRDDCSSLPAMIRHYESLPTQDQQLRQQQTAEIERTNYENRTFRTDGSSESDNSTEDKGEVAEWDRDENVVDEPDIDFGLDSDPTGQPSLEQMVMPGTRISRTRHNRTGHARRALQLTKNILANKGVTDSDEEEPSDGLERASADPRALLDHSVDSLNSEQKTTYQAIRLVVIGGAHSKRVVLIGPGGTGKSYLIDTIGTLLQLRLTEEHMDKGASTVRPRHSLLVKTAYTGVAAANIGGMTLHNALEITGRNIDSDVPDSSLTRLQRDWSNVAVSVIDEISFLSPENLYAVRARLGNIFSHKKHLPFAGLYVVMAGDPYQLGPVGGKTLWPRKSEREIGVKELVGRVYYMDCDAFLEFSIGQRNFGAFYDVLSRLRVGNCTQEDIDLLNSRALRPQGQVLQKEFIDALLVVGTNREAVMQNEAKLLAACQASNNDDAGTQTVRVWTHVNLSRNLRERLTKKDQAQHISRCLMRHRTSGGREKFIANAFCTFKGDRIRLNENICVELSLYNGACGTAMEIASSSTADPHESRQTAAFRMAECSDVVDLPIVSLQLDEESDRGPSMSRTASRVIAVEPRKFFIVKPFSATLWHLPLVPAHASTVHKVQSLTLPKVLVDVSRFQAACFVYVSLSRVKEIRNMALVMPLTWSDIDKYKREINMILSHMVTLRTKTNAKS